MTQFLADLGQVFTFFTTKATDTFTWVLSNPILAVPLYISIVALLVGVFVTLIKSFGN